MKSIATSAADKLLVELGISERSDLARLDDIAWACGALVRYDQLSGAEARVVTFGDQAIITVSTAVPDERRRRFAVAHEIGHLRLNRKGGGMVFCLAADLDPGETGARRGDGESELDANTFAAALLMPNALFGPRCRRCRPSLDLVRSLANEFDTSLTAAARRFTECTDEACAVVYSVGGRIRWFHPSKDFREAGLFIPVGDKLDSYSLASSFFEGKPVPARAEHVDASSWFAPGRFRSDGLVLEHSLAMPAHDAVITLLWIDQDIVSTGD
jgi:Zn-dependent peptidase ImmA (M78 family)